MKMYLAIRCQHFLWLVTSPLASNGVAKEMLVPTTLSTLQNQTHDLLIIRYLSNEVSEGAALQETHHWIHICKNDILRYSSHTSIFSPQTKRFVDLLILRCWLHRQQFRPYFGSFIRYFFRNLRLIHSRHDDRSTIQINMSTLLPIGKMLNNTRIDKYLNPSSIFFTLFACGSQRKQRSRRVKIYLSTLVLLINIM